MKKSNPRFAPRDILTLTALGVILFATSACQSASVELDEPPQAMSGEIVDCTLENGDAAQCRRHVVKFLPDNLKIGPFCPATLDDEGGIWNWDGDEAGLYRINGDFLRMLESQGFRFFNEDGEVYSFDIRVEEPTQTNECIAGSVDPDVEMTILIPIDPVMAASPTSLGTVAKVGISLDGVPIFADAPSVLHTGHMPALDTCGGHVDPGGWYHWHATASDMDAIFDTEGVDAECVNVDQSPTAQFGYAFDGYPMFGPQNYDGSVPEDLDECGGHVGLTEEGGIPGYHYHSGASFPNLPKCLVGVAARNNFSTNAKGGIGSANAGGGPGGGGPNDGGPAGARPDFDAIAEKLAVDSGLLERTLRDAGGPNADLSAVATELGIDADALAEAMQRPGG